MAATIRPASKISDIFHSDLITMNEVRTCTVDALKDCCLKRGFKMSGSSINSWPEFIVCTSKVPETSSAVEELLVDKRDYHDIYKEGLGTSVDSARLKTG